jgi:hypothetical protein
MVKSWLKVAASTSVLPGRANWARMMSASTPAPTKNSSAVAR